LEVLEWDNDCKGLVWAVAREEEWKAREVHNFDELQWKGPDAPGTGWEVTPLLGQWMSIAVFGYCHWLWWMLVAMLGWLSLQSL
jgi:hypothetical protein